MLRELALNIPGTGEFQAPGGIPTGGLSTTGGKIIQTGIGIAFVVAIILCLFVIIWGGVQWISSGGDKQKLATARSRIMYAIVGLIIVLLSFVIVNLFTTFLGLPSPLSTNLFRDEHPSPSEPPSPGTPAESGDAGQPADDTFSEQRDPLKNEQIVIEPAGDIPYNPDEVVRVLITNMRPAGEYTISIVDDSTGETFWTSLFTNVRCDSAQTSECITEIDWQFPQRDLVTGGGQTINVRFTVILLGYGGEKRATFTILRCGRGDSVPCG